MPVAAFKLERLKTLFKNTVLFGNEPTPELLAILSVYFVQGILGLARLAVSFFLKDDLGLSPAQMGVLTGIAAFPWVVKPAFGFLSDGLPLFGYRRRPYLVLSGILGCLSWLALALLVDAAWGAALTLLVTSLSVAISDVIVDSLVVERARRESLGRAGSLQSLTWGASAIGGLMTAYLSGWLLEHLSPRGVFQLTALFPLIVSVAAGFVAETRVQPQPPSEQKPQGTIASQIRQLRGAIAQKSILLPTAFIFLWQATPSADPAFFFFTTNELGFQPEFLGRVRLATSLASLAGIWLYQRFLKSVPFRQILGWSIVTSSVLGMSALLLVTHANRAMGIDDRWFSLGDSAILAVAGQVAFMPVLVLSARLCPPGIEATFFALLMSICNLSGLVSYELGAGLTHWLGVTETHFDRLWVLVAIANLSTLLPLPFLGWLPAGDPQTPEQGGEPPANLPPAELFERHSPGSSLEPPFIPELAPEFVAVSGSDRAQEKGQPTS